MGVFTLLGSNVGEYGILALNFTVWPFHFKGGGREMALPTQWNAVAVQWTKGVRAQPAYLPTREGETIVRRRTVESRTGIARAAHDAHGPGSGRERSWLVKTVVTGVSAQPVELAIEQSHTSNTVSGTEEDRPDEAYEATIISLDGDALERLLRLARE